MRGDGRCCAASAPHIQAFTLSGTAGRVDRQVQSRKRALPLPATPQAALGEVEIWYRGTA